ncbi:MAG: hypothetical protein WAX69_13280 [Victivallales bacterium]
MKCYGQNYRNYRIMEQISVSVHRLLKLGDCIEIHACEALTKTGKVTMNSRSIKSLSQCEADAPTKYCDTVYIHLETGGIQWIADFKNRADARRYAKDLVKDFGYPIDEF